MGKMLPTASRPKPLTKEEIEEAKRLWELRGGM